MSMILKVLAMIASLASTIYLIVKGVQSGLLIVVTVLGIVKFIITLAFCGLLVYIFVLLLPSKETPSPK